MKCRVVMKFLKIDIERKGEELHTKAECALVV